MSGRRGNKLSGQFIAHTRAMRESAAWRALPDNARRVLDRLELEHMAHGGAANGKLVCTYTDFAKWGIRRRSIPLAIRQAVALGFLEVTRRGYITSGDFKAPSTYRLTYVFGADSRLDGSPTNEWEAIDADAVRCRLAQVQCANGSEADRRKAA